jgi:RNA polymerase sigma-70 factor (ECF subfamily)
MGSSVPRPDEVPLPEETRDLLATRELLQRSQGGDASAREELCARFAPLLRRFLHARLPGRVRPLCDTDDIVQDVYAQALSRLESFEYRGPGSFWCYLRRIGLNQVQMLARRHALPTDEAVTQDRIAENGAAAGPLGSLVEKELLDAFEFSTEQRQAVLMRLELKLPYSAIAEECGHPSPAAARMAVCRAMEKLVERLASDGFAEG